MSAIRILVVDDHPMVRRGLRSLLTSYSDIEVVGEACDGETALESASTLLPDVVLLDVLLPGMNGIVVASRLQRVAPRARVMILTAFENQEYVVQSLQAGAYAYLLKTTSDEALIDSIRSVHQGKRLLSPSLMDKVLQQFQELIRDRARLEAGLSEDDMEILTLIARGATNKQIGDNRSWSERTVKRKVEHILENLGVSNRAQAAAEAMRRGLVQPDSIE